MSNTFLRIGHHLLFALNVFIAFLLLFEEKLQIPVWLQPVGRLHPMILHFPITLLLLTLISRLFLGKPFHGRLNWMGHLSRILLLAGAITAGFAVVMGIFLSKEEGYDTQTLGWHKWTGAGVFFISSLLYALHRKDWFPVLADKISAAAVILCMFFAGHYGAVLTHGENFFLEPLRSTPDPVPIDKALVFRDVIQPVLDRKCAGCHNDKKVKGELILTDYASAVKGGKTGRLYEPGDPASSLLIERIHLPDGDKKKMPPPGKAPLTPAETDLLHYWVRTDIDPETPVLSLDGADTLRLIAQEMLAPPAEQDWNLPSGLQAASPEQLKKLNNDYRLVTPLARGSAALAVSFFSADTYSKEALEELQPVRELVVSLNLQGMPVQDADLTTIAKFPHLQYLNLNFTPVTERGLSALKSLAKLRELNVSGTAIRKTEAELLANLKKLTVWNTPLAAAADLEQVQQQFPQLAIIRGYVDDGTLNKLNVPRLLNQDLVFDSATEVDIRHPVKGVEIRYTTDGSEPDLQQGKIWEGKLSTTESVAIRARAYKEGWSESDPVIFRLYKSRYKPDTVHFLSKPMLQYRGDYTPEFYHVLFDKKLGDFILDDFIFNLNSGQWVGYREDPVELLLCYQEPILLRSVGLHTAVITGRTVFPPKSIEIWGGPSPSRLNRLSLIHPEMPREYGLPEMRNLLSTMEPTMVRYIKIIAKPLEEAPAWHRSKGRKTLAVMDEIFIN